MGPNSWKPRKFWKITFRVRRSFHSIFPHLKVPSKDMRLLVSRDQVDSQVSTGDLDIDLDNRSESLVCCESAWLWVDRLSFNHLLFVSIY